MKKFSILLLILIFIIGCGEKLPSDVELFAQAREHESKQEFNKAIEKYDLIIENYPASPVHYKAIFMKGFNLLENLNDNKRAIETFDRLLSAYPESDLADDATVLREIAATGGDIMSAFEDSVKQE